MDNQTNNGFNSLLKGIEKISNEHQKRLDDNKKKHKFIVNLDLLFRKLEDSDNQYQIFYDICQGLNMKHLKYVEKETQILIKEEKGNN